MTEPDSNQSVTSQRIIPILKHMNEEGWIEGHRNDAFDGEPFEVIRLCLQECLTERRNND